MCADGRQHVINGNDLSFLLSRVKWPDVMRAVLARGADPRNAGFLRTDVEKALMGGLRELASGAK